MYLCLPNFIWESVLGEFPSLLSLSEADPSIPLPAGNELADVLSSPKYSEAADAFRAGKVLIRASGKHVEPFFISAPKTTKRKPTHTNVEADQFIEATRRKKFKRYPSRQKSVFCYVAPTSKITTFSKSIPRIYGNSHYLIFPPNGSSYFQSKETNDFYTSQFYTDIENWVCAGSGSRFRTEAQKAAIAYWQSGINKLRAIKPGLIEVFFEAAGPYYAISLLALKRESGKGFDQYIDSIGKKA